LGEDDTGNQNLIVTKEVHTHTGDILKNQSGEVNDKLKFQEENDIEGLSRRIQSLVPREIDLTRVDR
jgi:gas vesicle protein